MRMIYALLVYLPLFMWFGGVGRAQFIRPEPAFGIVAPSGADAEPGVGKTTSVARLRHRLVGKAVAAFTRATQFTKAGAWQNGVLELQKAIAIDPEFSEAHGNLGANFVRLGRYEEAASELRYAIRLDPSDDVYHANLAVALIQMRRNTEAELEARSAVAIDATNFKAHYVLGVLLARVPETRAEAIPHLIYAARFMPEGHQYLADVYRVNGEPELAQAELDRYRAALSRLAPKH